MPKRGKTKKLPKYKVKQRESLGWLFTACVKIDLNPLKLSIRHANKDFIRRFLQLVRLGKTTWEDLNIDRWQLNNPKEIRFLMQTISPHLHTQRERRIAELLIRQCEAPSQEIEDKLKPLIRKHNIHFFIYG